MKNLVLIFVFWGGIVNLNGVNFSHISGSDLFIGIGAQQIALGGAGTLVQNSAASIYWNVANLSQIARNQAELDLEIPQDVKNLILIFNPVFLKIGKRQITLGLARINRLKFKGESVGDEIWSGYSAHLLDLTMNSFSDFRGKIETDTNDYRVAVSYDASDRLNFGLAIIRYS
jgi:hypothetical protein